MRRFAGAFLLSAAPALLQAAGANDRSAHLNSLVDAERSFARSAAADGTRKAFLANLADDSIVFEPGPVSGQATWRARAESPSLLTWHPVFADVALAGDLGYTTGPFEYRANRTDEKAAAYGQFFSIWKKQPDGAWRVVLDVGTTNPSPAGKEERLTHPSLGAQTQGKPVRKPTADRARAGIVAMDRGYAELCHSKGAAEAYRMYAATDIRILRDGALPKVGVKTAIEAVKTSAGALTYKPEKGDVSLEGDLAYVYGSYEIAGDGKTTVAAASGSYVRVWKRDSKGRHRVVAELLRPHKGRS